jgi:hypothetical protein|nr:hypothetical protein [Rubripirellula sp.]
MQAIAAGRCFLQRRFTLYPQKAAFLLISFAAHGSEMRYLRGNAGLETEMTLLIGQVIEVQRAVVEVAKRRHVADRRGAGAQYSLFTAFHTPSFS